MAQPMQQQPRPPMSPVVRAIVEKIKAGTRADQTRGFVESDIQEVLTVEEFERMLYEQNRKHRIQARLEREQELKEGKARTSILVDQLVVALGGTVEEHSPFDCLRRPWTMASWPTP